MDAMKFDSYSGTVSDPGNPQVREQAPSQGGAMARDVNADGRARYDGSSTQYLGPEKHDVTQARPATGDPLDAAKTSWGAPLNRADLDGDSIVDGTKLSVLEQLGAVRKNAAGQYEWLGYPKEEAPKQEEITPSDMKLDMGTEQTIGAVVAKLGAPTVLSMLELAALGSEKVGSFDGDAASRMGLEPSEFASHRAAVTRSFEEMANRALAKAGIADSGAFRSWATQHAKGDFVDAVTAMFDRNDVGKLQALGKAYLGTAAGMKATGDEAGELSAEETAKVFKALQDSPIPAYQRTDGSIMVWPQGGNDWMPLQEARQRGLVRISVR